MNYPSLSNKGGSYHNSLRRPGANKHVTNAAMKKALFVFLVSLGFCLPAHAQWATTCTHDPNSSVNLRNGPSRSNYIIASIRNNEYIRAINWVWGGDGMRWYRVEYNGLVGWMRQDYLCR